VTEPTLSSSVNGTTSGADGQPPIDPSYVLISSLGSREVLILGPARCQGCGLLVFLWTDMIWRDPNRREHHCNPAKARHVAQVGLDRYRPLHELIPQAPEGYEW